VRRDLNMLSSCVSGTVAVGTLPLVAGPGLAGLGYVSDSS
jgi:hypothetical protein